ncbi:MAG: YdcF family protein [Anaerolineae bacterium]|nr:YdcF family protein [Anaerolineae bacterium]
MPIRWYQRTEGKSRRGRRLSPGCLFLIILLFLLVLSHRWWLGAVAQLLVVDQPPAQADAILVLGGGDGSRQERAIELYQQGWAPLIISSGDKPHVPVLDKTFAELGADYMVARGIPRQTILLLKTPISTYEEALESLQLAQKRGLRALLVVTDNYHTRRASLVFRHVYRGTGIQLIFVSAKPSWFQLNSWWTNERALVACFEEYIKLGLYLAKGYLF